MGLMKRLVVALVLAVAVLLASAGAARAAAPRIVIISGKPLTHQVVISDWRRIFMIVDGLAGVRPAARTQLAYRPRMRFSMFWGPQWNEYLSSGKPAAALRPRPPAVGEGAHDLETTGRSDQDPLAVALPSNRATGPAREFDSVP